MEAEEKVATGTTAVEHKGVWLDVEAEADIAPCEKFTDLGCAMAPEAAIGEGVVGKQVEPGQYGGRGEPAAADAHEDAHIVRLERGLLEIEANAVRKTSETGVEAGDGFLVSEFSGRAEICVGEGFCCSGGVSGDGDLAALVEDACDLDDVFSEDGICGDEDVQSGALPRVAKGLVAVANGGGGERSGEIFAHHLGRAERVGV